MARKRPVPAPPIPAYLDRSVSLGDAGEERRRILEAEGLNPIPARLHNLSLGRTTPTSEVTAAKEKAAELAARFAYLAQAAEAALEEGNGQKVVELRNERDACEIDWWVAERAALQAEIDMVKAEADAAVGEAKPYHRAFERLQMQMIETQKRVAIIEREAAAAENVAGALMGRAAKLERDLARLKSGPEALTGRLRDGWSAA